MIPKRENGANDESFFAKQRGRRTSDITPMSDWVLVVAIENVESRPRMESARTMEYDKFNMKPSKTQKRAIIHEVLVPRVLTQQST